MPPLRTDPPGGGVEGLNPMSSGWQCSAFRYTLVRPLLLFGRGAGLFSALCDPHLFRLNRAGLPAKTARDLAMSERPEGT